MADEFEDVFILASDVVNFTKMSAASQPKDVVRVLSQLFSAFDTMSEAMGVYKVQTWLELGLGSGLGLGLGNLTNLTLTLSLSRCRPSATRTSR